MITDEELADLPEDPELAFVKFERIIRERLVDLEGRAFRGEYSADSARLEYINRVLAAASVFSIDALSRFSTPPHPNEDIESVCSQVASVCDNITTQIRIRNASRARGSSVGLDQTAKAKIGHYILQIKGILETANLPEDKRDSLSAKLNEFASEVDRNRTRLDSAMAFYIAVCDGIGQGFEKLEPARKWIDSIAALLGRQKETEEAPRPILPSPMERKRIELSHPPPDDPAITSLDDEIPF